MTSTASEHPVRHLLWCLLVALRTAINDNTLRSETARRRFVSEWLNGARRSAAFIGLNGEIATLRQLLDTDKSVPIDGLLHSLLVNSGHAEHCALFRFRAALSTLMKQGWRTGVCRFPDEILHETLQRAQNSRCHILQLTRTEDSFRSTGEMTAPVTFQLIQHRKKDRETAERTFWNEQFMVVTGREEELGRQMTVRTIYIGHHRLPEAVWGARSHDIWRPSLH